MTLAPKNYWHFQHVLSTCGLVHVKFWVFLAGGISGADVTVSKTRKNNHQTELFMTILIVNGNASVGGTFLSMWWVLCQELVVFGQFNNTAHLSDDISGLTESTSFPLSLLTVPFFFSFWNTLTCRIEKNLNWFASGSRSDWRGLVFRVAIAMSIYEMTEWLGFSPLCETLRLPESYK